MVGYGGHRGSPTTRYQVRAQEGDHRGSYPPFLFGASRAWGGHFQLGSWTFTGLSNPKSGRP